MLIDDVGRDDLVSALGTARRDVSDRVMGGVSRETLRVEEPERSSGSTTISGIDTGASAIYRRLPAACEDGENLRARACMQAAAANPVALDEERLAGLYLRAIRGELRGA